MKITLNPSQCFWGLMDPVDLTLTLSLTENQPTQEIDEKKLYPWELSQIAASVKDRKISISLQLEDLLKSLPETPNQEKKMAAKKATKIKA